MGTQLRPKGTTRLREWPEGADYRSTPFLSPVHRPRYIPDMSPNAKRLLERLSSWPDEDLAELEEFAREIEARRTGVYALRHCAGGSSGVRCGRGGRRS